MKPTALLSILLLILVCACTRSPQDLSNNTTTPLPRAADSEYVISSINYGGIFRYFNYDTALHRYTSSYNSGSNTGVANLVHFIYDAQKRIRAEVSAGKSAVYTFDAANRPAMRYTKSANYPYPAYTDTFYTSIPGPGFLGARDSFVYNGAGRLTAVYYLSRGGTNNGIQEYLTAIDKVNYSSPGDTLVASIEHWSWTTGGAMYLSSRTTMNGYNNLPFPVYGIQNAFGGCLFALGDIPSALPDYTLPSQRLFFLMKNCPDNITWQNFSGAGSGTYGYTYRTEPATGLISRSAASNGVDYTDIYYTKVQR